MDVEGIEMRGRSRAAVTGRRIALAALAMSVSLLVGAGADQRATATTGDRVKPKSGPYKGKTTQDRPVTFELRKRRVRDFTASVKMSRSCRKAGYPGDIAIPQPVKLSRKEKFSFRGGDSPFGKQLAVIKGEFVSKRKVDGTIRLDFDLRNPIGTCRFKKTVRYTAQRGT